MALTGKALIAQGGGPTAVINQTLVGVVLEARKYQNITKVYGAVNGVQGIVNENFLDLTQETTHNLEQVALCPSSALCSTRVKPDEEFCKKIFKVLAIHDIRYFFYVGGNDSADTVRIVSEEAKKANYEMVCVHIPKTIDNDLRNNDHTPGFGSAARFVVQAFKGVNLDVRSLPGIYIGVVMGRDAGFLTAASGLARDYDDDGPHLIYVPEKPFSRDKFVADVKRVYEKYGRCIVAVSEGIRTETGELFVASLKKDLEVDPHGNVSLSGTAALGEALVAELKKELSGRIRCDTFGYLQRSFFECVSDVDRNEAREVGERAVQFAVWGEKDGSVGIRRTGNYSVDYVLNELKDVARITRSMPDEFISKDGNDITNDFVMYCRPLLGSGMRTAARLRAPKVPKLLDK
ncbi:MAG: 6-phosphofructokinase [Clostridiales bacterium]|nr:6-phosphofructokinase [Clostridiales bacterium]